MLKYKGGGFLRGVPARDLQEDEVAKFGHSFLVRSGLYYQEKPEFVYTQDIEEDKPAIQIVEDTKPVQKKRTKKESKTWLE